MSHTAFNGLARLNERQRSVLFCVCKGFRNSEIAKYCRVSERTAKDYVSQLFLIFDVTNRTELVGKLLEEHSDLLEQLTSGQEAAVEVFRKSTRRYPSLTQPPWAQE